MRNYNAPTVLKCHLLFLEQWGNSSGYDIVLHKYDQNLQWFNQLNQDLLFLLKTRLKGKDMIFTAVNNILKNGLDRLLLLLNETMDRCFWNILVWRKIIIKYIVDE